MSRINTSDGQPDRGKESERSMRLLKPRTLGGEQTRTALLALLPSLIVFCVFTVYPIFHSLYLSFFNVGLVAAQGRYVGFNNYLNLVKNPTFRKAVRNTITYTIGVVPVEMLCSLIVAVLLNTKLKLQSFFRTASLPRWSPPWSLWPSSGPGCSSPTSAWSTPSYTSWGSKAPAG